MKSANVITLKGGRVFFVEHGEAQAVETCETFLRSDPEIAVLRLDDRLYRVLRQSVFSQPRLVAKLVEASVRIEGGDASAGEEKQCHGNSKMTSKMASKMSWATHVSADTLTFCETHVIMDGSYLRAWR